MNGRQGGPEQQRGLIVAGGPSGFAIDALPHDLELGIHHDHGLVAPAPGAGNTVFVEQVRYGKSFSHAHVFGSDGRAR
jgi:hypothetical protein